LLVVLADNGIDLPVANTGADQSELSNRLG
jgi:hypothetical protein